jgi:hypothetical protein
VQDLLEEMVCNANLLPAEHKAAASILRTIMKDDVDPKKVDLKALLAAPEVSYFIVIVQIHLGYSNVTSFGV